MFHLIDTNNFMIVNLSVITILFYSGLSNNKLTLKHNRDSHIFDLL